MAVPARLSLVTLGVRDVERATAFYVALGWTPSPSSVPGEVTFFNTAGGLLALWGERDQAADAGLAPGRPSFRGVACSINLESEGLVDEVFAHVEAAGGTVVKAPVKTEWGGYSGYFSDPDEHLWEVAHNPGWPIGPDGRPTLP